MTKNTLNTSNSSYEEMIQMIQTIQQQNRTLEKKVGSLRRTNILTGSAAISIALVAPIVAANWAVISATLVTAAPMIGIVVASLGAMLAVIGMSALVYKNRTAIKEGAEKALKNTKDGIVYAANRTVDGAGLLAKKTVDGAVYTKEKIEQGITSVKETTKRKASDVAYNLANKMYNLSGKTDYSEKRQENFTERERNSVLKLRKTLKEAFINDKKDLLPQLVLDTMKLKIMPKLESEIKGLKNSNSELPEYVALINQLKKDKRFIEELDVASLKKFIIENRLPKGNYLFDSICSEYGYEIQNTIDMHNEENLAEKEAYKKGSAKLKNELKETFGKTEEKVIKSFLNEMKSQIVKELKSDIKTIEYGMKHGSIPKGDDTTLLEFKKDIKFMESLNVKSLKSLVTEAKNERFDAILCEYGDRIKEIMSNTQPGLFHNNSLYIGVTSSDDRSNDDHFSNSFKFEDEMDSVMSELNNLGGEIDSEIKALATETTPLSRSSSVDSFTTCKSFKGNTQPNLSRSNSLDSGVDSNNDRSNDEHSHSNLVTSQDDLNNAMSELNERMSTLSDLAREITSRSSSFGSFKNGFSPEQLEVKDGHKVEFPNNTKETDSGVGSSVPSSCNSDEDLVRSSSSDLSKKTKITRSASYSNLNDASQDSSRSRSSSLSSVSGGFGLPTHILLTKKDGSMKSQDDLRKTGLREKLVEPRIRSQMALNANSVTQLSGNTRT